MRWALSWKYLLDGTGNAGGRMHTQLLYARRPLALGAQPEQASQREKEDVEKYNNARLASCCKRARFTWKTSALCHQKGLARASSALYFSNCASVPFHFARRHG